jgi:hypothetical protein
MAKKNLVTTDELPARPVLEPRPATATVATGPSGKAMVGESKPPLLTESLDQSEAARDRRKEAIEKGMEDHLEVLAERCRKSGVKIYPRRKA